jgi:predicted transcriptional regulator
MEFVRPLEGSEIARELGITRQAVSNILKRAMMKFYNETKKIDSNWGPFDVSCAMMRMLLVSHNADDIKKFYNLFPPSIRDMIEKDALENHVSDNFRKKYKEN